ncbi:MAG: hypothetical protein M0Z55_08155, partial [Peptococcaceae bacterium]|nr:hypothetical protein [Peptococcaceae bacterium]
MSAKTFKPEPPSISINYPPALYACNTIQHEGVNLMLVHRHGFLIFCKAKELKNRLSVLGSPEAKIITIVQSRLN